MSWPRVCCCLHPASKQQLSLNSPVAQVARLATSAACLLLLVVHHILALALHLRVPWGLAFLGAASCPR
jgi:hypothetical protein